MHGRVATVAWPSPGLARIVLKGDGLADFAMVGATDAYVNVAIPPEGAPYGAPFALDDLRDLPREQRPFRRRYTVRRWDGAAHELTLEFVVHGDSGVAGPWAKGAQPGDALVFTGPAGGYAPDAGADWHLLVGDESALPAVAASLEAVPAGAKAIVRLVADEHELDLDCPGDLDLAWLRRDGDDRQLEHAVADLAFPSGSPHAFVHGEAAEIRAVRRHLLAERGVDPARLSCSPYWRRGMTDEAWRAVKAAWNAEVAADV